MRAVPQDSHPRQHVHADELEALNVQLNDPKQLEAYKRPCDNYRTRFLPGLFGRLLV